MSADGDTVREALTEHFVPGRGGCAKCHTALAALARLEAERDALAEALRAAESALAWALMATNWAVFREESRVWTSNEMHDIHQRLDSEVTRVRAALDEAGLE